MGVGNLTRGSICIVLRVDLVVLCDFYPLMGLHAGLTQPFSTLHTKTYGSCVVLTTRADLAKVKNISITLPENNISVHIATTFMSAHTQQQKTSIDIFTAL